MQSAVLTTPTYTDFRGLAEMRARAEVDPNASLRQVAKQFESIFIQMMLKSMRDASMGDDIFDSDQSRLYRDMFDKQIALDMASSKGIGIAETLVRQLGRQRTLTATQGTAATVSVTTGSDNTSVNTEAADSSIPVKQQQAVAAEKTTFSSAEEFRQYLMPHARKAAAELGVSPQLLISQAALETGWGKAIARHADGRSSYNLFNIKADHRWQGDRLIKSTLEYDNGVAKYEKASFRSYRSYADSFNDYVNFLRQNGRYADALQQQGDDQAFIKQLHKAGYATDPDYADKVMNIYQRNVMQIADSSDSGMVG